MRRAIVSRRIAQLGQTILRVLDQRGAPLPLGELAERIHGRLPTLTELRAIRSALGALARRGVASVKRVALGDRREVLCWVPGEASALLAAAPTYSWARQNAEPRTDVDARERTGPSSETALQPETPRIVWTLHRNLLAPDKAVIAVRRRVLGDEGGLRFEVARGAAAFVPALELSLRGSARTCRGPGTGPFHLLLQVYDHRPTPEERAAWLAQRAQEQRALSEAPDQVWLILPGEPGGPDRALACRARRAPPERLGPGTSRADLELRLPFRGYRDAPVVNLVELCVTGLARLSFQRSTFVICVKRPGEELLEQTAASLRGRPDEGWFREDAAALLGSPRTESIATGEAAITELGLTLPCTAHEVGRAFRRRVIADRAHPDQGGSDEEFRELMRIRTLAIQHLEQKALPARSAA